VAEHSGYGVAVVFGPDGDTKNDLQTVDYFSNFATPGTVKAYSLPELTIPVASVAGDGPDVFLGLHETDGIALTFGENNQNHLQSLLMYWEQLTVPQAVASRKSTSSGQPELFKINSFTGAQEFHVQWKKYGDGVGAMAATISAMTTTNDYLIVAGSVNGKGDANGPYGVDADDDDDWDGYVTFADKETGELADDKRAMRFDFPAGKNDYVNDICVLGSFLFVVGTTEGIAEGIHKGGAFVVKINLETSEIIWQRQIAGNTVTGLACAVTSQTLFVGGTTSIDLENNSLDVPSATQDVFVTAMDPDIGQSLWIKQIDTSSEETDNNRADQMVGIDLSPQGNANVMVNSMNILKGLNDIFFFDMNKDTGANALQSPISDDNTDAKDDTNGIPNNTVDDDDNDNNNQTTIAIAIALPLSLVVLVFGYQLFCHASDDVPAVGGRKSHNRAGDNSNDLALEEDDASIREIS
jgi:hypothetical protein